MADDMFGMLYSSLDPKKQLLTAVSNNMVDSVRQLTQLKTLDINSSLMLQNGNTALHVSAQKGFADIMKLLLKHRADPNIQNHFGFSPLAMALRCGHEKCVKLLLEKGGYQSQTKLIWLSKQMNGNHAWVGYTPDVITIVLIATPDFTSLGQSIKDIFYNTFLHSLTSAELVKAFFLAGNGLSQDQMTQLTNQIEAKKCNHNVELAHWLKTFESSHSLTLRHLARTAIRKNVHPNVYYSLKQLPLPPILLDYLIFNDIQG